MAKHMLNCGVWSCERHGLKSGCNPKVRAYVLEMVSLYMYVKIYTCMKYICRYVCVGIFTDKQTSLQYIDMSFLSWMNWERWEASNSSR